MVDRLLVPDRAIHIEREKGRGLSRELVLAAICKVDRRWIYRKRV
jgi:hypothetical protein